ncbi:MAG: hypothetical protein EOR00_09555 [Mesorhizobium sp.]|uniref:hypothetical protein n=1 Tax=Mesorhizobium sp. TaxID=1871066 RepID=UPI000FE6C5E9|nr:hypothetical protein [Mesorhizobium sp.]RWP18872.1 MAG: hypothetical protein EOR00_09555 [Mesorhizobium sp.]
MDEVVSGLIGLIFIVAVVTLGGLFVTSTAILYYEEATQGSLSGSFKCHYFTGTRTITISSLSSTGCKRFITVGEAIN